MHYRERNRQVTIILLRVIPLLAQFILFAGYFSLPRTASGAYFSDALIIAVDSAGAPTAHGVALRWNSSTSKDVVGYFVYRGTVPGPPYATFTKLALAPIRATTYTDSTVAAGATYYYVVTAVNGSGKESAYSNQASATIAGP